MHTKLLFVSPFVLLSALTLDAAPTQCRPADSFEQGYALRQNQMPAAYNAPARIDVRGTWDFYATGSYIFWQPIEDNLTPGIIYSGNLDNPLGHVVDMDFKYHSGFKTALGVFGEEDNWELFAEYTWLRGHAFQHTNAAFFPLWGDGLSNSGLALPCAKSRWDLSLQTVDAQLARSYYVGTRLTLRPFFGGRGAWINQHLSTIASSTTISIQTDNTSHSWGVGPEVGVTAHWLLGYGIRAIGTAEGDTLFSVYNLHFCQEGSLQRHWSQRDVHRLRPHTNLELGFGYGSYFCNHNYHADISATYGFQVFWDQNMFRGFEGSASVAGGNLYTHGATGTLRFDF